MIERRRRALITRPQEDSADAAIALARRGITPVLAPMMRIEYATADIENETEIAQAVLFTSRNGVRAFARMSQRRDVAVYAVGDSTAMLARENGFVRVESAHGDSADLARLVIDRLDPADGLLFHAAGATVAGDLADALNKAGFKTVRRTLYEAKPVDALTADTVTALRDRTLDYVLFFSPRTARIFCDLVNDAGLGRTCDSLTAVCLSEAVSDEISGLTWKETAVAAAPTTDALLAVLGDPRSEAAETGPLPPGPGPGPGPKPAAGPARPAPNGNAGTDEKPAPDASVQRQMPDRQGTAGDISTGKETPMETPMETPKPAGDTPAKLETAARPPVKPPQELPGKPSPETSEKPSQESPEESSGNTPAPAQPVSRDTAAHKTTIMGALPVALPVAAVLTAALLAGGYMTLPTWRDRLPPDVRAHLAGADAASGATAATLRRENAELLARIDDLDKILIAANAELATTRNDAGRQVADLTARLEASEKTVAGLRAAAADSAKIAQANAALTEKTAALERALADALEARSLAVRNADAAEAARQATAAKSAAQAEALNRTIAGLEKDLATARQAVITAGRSDTIALAANKLRNAIGRAAPFAEEIAELKRLGGNNPDIAAAIARMEPFSEKGVPGRAALFAGLPETVDAVLAAARAPVKTGWLDQALDKLTGFVTIRRIDGKGAGVDAVLARAERTAREGDLAATVAELSALTGPAAKAAASWLAAAHSRLAAEDAGAALDEVILEAYASGSATKGAGQ